MTDTLTTASPIDLLPTGLLIDGEWRDATDGATFDVLDPATGECLLAIADATAADGLAAIEAARAAQQSWARTTARQRADILQRTSQRLVADKERLAFIMTREMGKPLADARGEVQYAADFFRWFAEEAVRISGTHAVAPDGRGQILTVREPVGPTLLITPWNFPLAMGARKIGPAIAAGCTIVFKPAPQTPLSSLALAEILQQEGLPTGVLNVIATTRAAEVVEPLLRGGIVRKLSFTGSTATGRLLLEQCAGTIVRTSLELGGNAPFIVFDDADLDVAIEAAVAAKMRNMGEACTAANRFFVHTAVAEEFTARLTARLQAMTVGNGLDQGTDVGPLIDQAAIAKVERLVADAVSRGATVHTGGSALAGQGYFYPPTVLSDVAPQSQILRTEVFGPVAPILTFADEAEVIETANDTEWGLVGYVITADLNRATRLSAALEVGMVGINTGIVSDVAAPFGGIKQSGLGREGGHLGIDEYLNHKYIAVPTPPSV
jgi:succinate-semialdehyde dehydrogenase/glutarate-semialdehyde dehydrogenase